MEWSGDIRDDVVTKLLKLLKDEFGDTFAAYYDGDPLIIPLSNYPALMVEATQGAVSLSATGTDDLETTILITVALNKRDDAEADDDKDLSEKKARRVIEARDAVTASFRDDTIVGVLRKNITINQTAIGQALTWEYAIQPRGSEVVAEARISLSTTERVYVPNRN